MCFIVNSDPNNDQVFVAYAQLYNDSNEVTFNKNIFYEWVRLYLLFFFLSFFFLSFCILIFFFFFLKTQRQLVTHKNKKAESSGAPTPSPNPSNLYPTNGFAPSVELESCKLVVFIQWTINSKYLFFCFCFQPLFVCLFFGPRN